MLMLIIGGSASGKSAYAEECAANLPGEPRIYLATMHAADAESLRRVERHRRMRAGRAFDTLECPSGLDTLEIPASATVLLEDLSNWVANELYGSGTAGADTLETVWRGLCHLRGSAKNLVVVSNEIFSDGVAYDPSTREFLTILGALNRRLAETADAVAEVVSTIPIFHRGGPVV